MGWTKVQDVLQHKDKGISVEDARKAMLEAGEAPSGIAVEKAKNVKVGVKGPVAVAPRFARQLEASQDGLEQEFTEEEPGKVTETKRPPVPVQTVEVPEDEETGDIAEPTAPPVKAAQAPTPEKQPKVERIETDQFLAEIRQEGGKWIAELQYKNGAGTERWSATTKNELMMELLKGKGNATLRVKEAVRRERLGGPKLDKEYSLPESISPEKFNAYPDEVKTQVIEAIALKNASLFRDLHPEFIATDNNGSRLNEFLKENNLPMTVRNLEHAFESLLEENKLDVRKTAPVAATVITEAKKTPTVTEDSVAGEDDEPAAPAAKPVVAPVTTIRKRGTTGLRPGDSSLPADGDAVPETGNKSRELSEAELRAMPMADLKRIVIGQRKANAANR